MAQGGPSIPTLGLIWVQYRDMARRTIGAGPLGARRHAYRFDEGTQLPKRYTTRLPVTRDIVRPASWKLG